MQLYQKQKKILKKNMTLAASVFPKMRTLKTRLGKCLKSSVSENSTTSNMVNAPKHCLYLHHSALIIYIDHCQVNLVGKSLSYLHAKS